MIWNPEYVVSAIVWPKDGAGREIPHYLTEQPRLSASDVDGVPAVFESVLVGGWQLQRAIANQGAVLGETPAPQGKLALDRSSGRKDQWDLYEWEGARVEVFLSEKGHASRWADYRRVCRGTVEGRPEKSPLLLELTVGSANPHLGQPVIETQYRGFGGGAYLEPGAVGRVSAASLMPAGAAASIEIFGRLPSLPAVATGLFIHSDVVGLVVDAAGKLWLASAGNLIDTRHTVTPGPFYYSVTVAEDGVTHKVYGRVDDLVERLHDYVSPVPVSWDGALTINEWDGNSGELEVWELRVYNGARSLARLALQAEAPYAEDADFIDDYGIGLWRFEELGKPKAVDRVAEAQMEFDLDPAWTDSLEGDDPAEFPGGGPRGVRPWVSGLCHNVPGVLVSTRNGRWQFSGAPAAAIRRLYVEGQPLATDISLVATAGEVVYHGGGRFTCETARYFSGFIAGQTYPPRAGQQVHIADWPDLDGPYTVADEGISADGRTLVLLAVHPSVPAGPCPAGASMSTPPAEVMYTFDNPTATATISGEAPAGAVTADLIGYSGESLARVGDQLSYISGLPVDNRMSWNPGVGLYSPQGSPKTRRALMDEAARAAVGWWTENLGGRIVCGSWEIPEGARPRVALVTTRPAELPLRLQSVWMDCELRGEIVGLETAAENVPAHRIEVRYQIAQVTQDKDAVAAQVAPSRREYLARGFMPFSRQFKRGSSSQPLEPQTTALWRQPDSIEWILRGEWLFAEKRTVLPLSCLGIPFGALEPGDLCFLESPHFTALRRGALAIIAGIDESTSSNETKIEVIF